MKGAIIAVVGAPGCGKSYLVKKLAKHYRGKAILEEGSAFPERILEDLKKRHRNLELFFWWRNKLIREMALAEAIAKRGRIVVIDNYWATNETYIQSFFKGFEKTLAKETCKIDEGHLSHPDAIIFLRASHPETERMIRQRGRTHEQDKAFLKVTKEVDRQHALLFKRLRLGNICNIVEFYRDGLDFDNEKDLKGITSKIDRILSSKRI